MRVPFTAVIMIYPRGEINTFERRKQGKWEGKRNSIKIDSLSLANC
jgi:hypothetical protein